MIGKVLYHHNSLESTNAEALRIAGLKDFEEGTVILTDHQTAGRGQMGTIWLSQPRMNLTLSIMLKPTFIPVHLQFQLSKIAAVGIAHTLQGYVQGRINIKWPNDICINGRKIAGILIQNSLQGQQIAFSIVGIGLNVNQVAFSEAIPNPTSLKIETGENLALAEVRAQLFSHLDQLYSTAKSNLHVADEFYDHYLYRRDHKTEFTFPDGSTGWGWIRRVDISGRLVIEHLDSDLRSYNIKEISYQ